MSAPFSAGLQRAVQAAAGDDSERLSRVLNELMQFMRSEWFLMQLMQNVPVQLSLRWWFHWWCIQINKKPQGTVGANDTGKSGCSIDRSKFDAGLQRAAQAACDDSEQLSLKLWLLMQLMQDVPVQLSLRWWFGKWFFRIYDDSNSTGPPTPPTSIVRKGFWPPAPGMPLVASGPPVNTQPPHALHAQLEADTRIDSVSGDAYSSDSGDAYSSDWVKFGTASDWLDSAPSCGASSGDTGEANDAGLFFKKNFNQQII